MDIKGGQINLGLLKKFLIKVLLYFLLILALYSNLKPWKGVLKKGVKSEVCLRESIANVAYFFITVNWVGSSFLPLQSLPHRAVSASAWSGTHRNILGRLDVFPVIFGYLNSGQPNLI